MANEFGILIDRRNGALSPSDTSLGSQPKVAVHFSPGCMRGIEDVGAACALFEEGLLQQCDGYFGTSVGAIALAFAENPARGLPIFSKLIGEFIKLPKGDVRIPYTSRVIMSEETYVRAGIVATSVRSNAVIQRFIGRGSTYINQAHLMGILRDDVVPDIDAIASSSKERILYYTSMDTGDAVAYDMRSANSVDELLPRLDASSHVPILSGQGVMIDGKLCFDGCFSASYPIHDIAARGYNRIIVLLNEHPERLAENEEKLLGLVRFFYGRSSKSHALRAIENHARKMPDVLTAMLRNDVKVDDQPIHIRVLYPEKSDPKLDPLEMRPEPLEEGFWRGYARGKIFASEIRREHEKQRAYQAHLGFALGLGPHPKTHRAEVA